MTPPSVSDNKRYRRVNGALNIFHGAVSAFQLFVLPLCLLPSDKAWGASLLLCVLATNPWWAFIHETLHGILFDNRRSNRLTGRLHAILYGAPFDLLRWGHLLHHAWSRTERERAEVYVAGQQNSAAVRLSYYFRLCGGLYLFEVIGGMALLLPRALLLLLSKRLARRENMVEELTARLLMPKVLRDARWDAAAIMALYAASAVCYGANAWMLLLALAARGFLISMVDNVFHYATPLDNPRHANNLFLPAPLSLAMLHFNLHGAHHQRASMPWWQLADYHRAAGYGYQGNGFRALLSQLEGPIPAARLECKEKQQSA